jgi:hypothetical protein
MRVDQYKADGSWLRMQALQVAGPGTLSGVAARSSTQVVQLLSLQ